MKKVLSGIAATALVSGLLLASPGGVFAGNEVSWNGCGRRLCWKSGNCNWGCNNNCGGTSINLSNDATVVNKVTAISNTGGNKISKSVGGSNSITTGQATVEVTIENNVNTNFVSVH